MKRLKTMPLLVLATMLAVVFAAPSVASANWLQDHEAITQNEIIEFEGSIAFSTGAGGTTCNVAGAIEAEAGTKSGQLIEMNHGTGEECTSTGMFEGCVITNATVRNSTTGEPIHESPSPVQIKDDDLVVESVTIDVDYAHPSETCALQSGGGPIPLVGYTWEFDEITLFDKDDGDPTIVNNLGVRGEGKFSFYNTTAAKEANAPLTTGTMLVNESSSTLTLVDQDVWGWEGAE